MISLTQMPVLLPATFAKIKAQLNNQKPGTKNYIST